MQRPEKIDIIDRLIATQPGTVDRIFDYLTDLCDKLAVRRVNSAWRAHLEHRWDSDGIILAQDFFLSHCWRSIRRLDFGVRPDTCPRPDSVDPTRALEKGYQTTPPAVYVNDVRLSRKCDVFQMIDMITFVLERCMPLEQLSPTLAQSRFPSCPAPSDKEEIVAVRTQLSAE